MFGTDAFVGSTAHGYVASYDSGGKETPWQDQSPRPLGQIGTVNQAAAYAYGSYKAAQKKCPNIASQYLALHENIVKGYLLGTLGDAMTSTAREIWNDSIGQIDALCISASGSPPVPSSKPASGSPKFDVDKVPTGGGSSWLWWILGGAGVYVLLNKKLRKKIFGG